MDVNIIHIWIILDETTMGLEGVEPNLVLRKKVVRSGPSAVEGSISLVLDLTGIPRSVRDQDSMTTGDTYIKWGWIPGTIQDRIKPTDQVIVVQEETVVVGSMDGWEGGMGH